MTIRFCAKKNNLVPRIQNSHCNHRQPQIFHWYSCGANGRSFVRSVYDHVITKFSGMGRFTYPWCSASTRFARGSSAIKIMKLLKCALKVARVNLPLVIFSFFLISYPDLLSTSWSNPISPRDRLYRSGMCTGGMKYSPKTGGFRPKREGWNLFLSLKGKGSVRAALATG